MSLISKTWIPEKPKVPAPAPKEEETRVDGTCSLCGERKPIRNEVCVDCEEEEEKSKQS